MTDNCTNKQSQTAPLALSSEITYDGLNPLCIGTAIGTMNDIIVLLSDAICNIDTDSITLNGIAPIPNCISITDVDTVTDAFNKIIVEVCSLASDMTNVLLDISTLQNNVTNLQNNITNIKNDIIDINTSITTNTKTGEIKMYGYPSVALAATGFEFDANGVGRAAGHHGAVGDWEGWILLIGQIASTISTNDAGVTLAHWKNGSTFLADTKQSYPAGADSGSASYNTPFKTVGANSVTLDTANVPVYVHNHTVTEIQHTHELIGAVPNPLGSSEGYIYVGANSQTILINGVTITGYAGIGAIQGSTSGLKVDNNASGVAATSHENRPLSFVTCFAVYANAVGSTS